MATPDLWTYRDQTVTQTDLAGFEVEAQDGKIGNVDEATYDVGGSFLVIDTGPWIFGKRVMLPAGVVGNVDLDTQTVFVDRTKDEIKNSPEFDEDAYTDENYRTELGSYYGTVGDAYGAEGPGRRHPSDGPIV